MFTWAENRFHFKLDRTKPNAEEEDEEDDQEAPEEEEENQAAETQDDPPASPKQPPPPAKPKAMAPAPLPPPKPEPKPDPTEKTVPESFVNQVRDEIPKSDMDHSIEQYYGKVSGSSQKKIESRLIKQLFEMRQKGEPLNLDEAVRRDRFEESVNSRRK
jgi:hypothetical protein